MARCEKTIEELKLIAALVGGWYDPHDHTINITKGRWDGSREELDADTLEPVPPDAYIRRTQEVDRGERGIVWRYGRDIEG